MGPGREYIIMHAGVLIVFIVQFKYGVEVTVFVASAVSLPC